MQKPFAATEVTAVIDALNETYVKGKNHGHWHLYTFTLRDGRSIRGRVVQMQDEGIVVGLDEPGYPQETVPLDEVQTLLIEAE